MLKQALALSVATILVSGCTTTKQPETASITNADIQSSLQESQTELITAFNQQCSQQSEQITAVSEELKKLQAQLDKSFTETHSVMKKTAATPKPVPVQVTNQCSESNIGDKFMLGEVESVYVDEVKTKFATRIDTGAESSSLDARNIVLFERNGDQWVRFDVLTNGPDKPANTFESKVERMVRIKQDADSEDDRRPVIHAHLKIGKYSAETDLNLTDRSHLDYPLLLGRKFMKDIAVVDVGQIYIHGKAKDQVTTLIK
ncbi:ATP-dependent zinc protease family protein [Shewanella gaetbuli]|uniref:ATP-dependent zinc protease n=1 Tax=Shewanella gaetbuli TaxID=220752 RepID=A0A9X2CK06_9GAMM|nr:ATP-dependent zinc protease [Shewanella gaetbuli]MCL1142606.1 ATP-dependent zinc protease [Shewanella gaetbuli]